MRERQKKGRRRGRQGVGVALAFWIGVMASPGGEATESRKIEELIEATEPSGSEAGPEIRQRQKRLQRGKTVYRRFCIHCHGPRGKGDGAASAYLFPRPRDLSRGIFKLRSTKTNTLPLDSDLARTIRRGIPGTAMPAWGDVFSQQTIRALVEYIRTFSRRFQMETPEIVVQPGLEPPFDSRSIRMGQTLYRQLRCGRCHGKRGERQDRLPARIQDAWGGDVPVYNLQDPALYKAGPSGEALYRTLVSGMDGTPMNSYDYLSDPERWHLIHYLQSLMKPDPSPTDAPAYSRSMTASRAGKTADLGLGSPLWKTVPAATLKLFPIRVGEKTVSRVRVQVAATDRVIGFRLQWEDPVPEKAGPGARDFLDAAALQFALDGGGLEDLPFFGMGEKDRPVHLWHWRADASQKILSADPSGQSLDPGEASLHPPGSLNLALDPFRESPVEELNAQGFGTLSVQSLEDQQIRGEGVWEEGTWTVVFVRRFQTPGPLDVQFTPPGPYRVAVAVWDGHRGDRSSRKMVTLWQTLRLPPGD